jgi:antitoxin (DNA-binding transcriptional repressor) of toxin-antitoxin stability system
MITKFKKRDQIIGLKDLRLNTNKYINRLNKGETFIVVRRSRPVFNMIPFDEDNDSLWKTVVDFTKINKKGVSAELILKSLKKLNEQDRQVSK